jgi:glutaredoxin
MELYVFSLSAVCFLILIYRNIRKMEQNFNKLPNPVDKKASLPPNLMVHNYLPKVISEEIKDFKDGIFILALTSKQCPYCKDTLNEFFFHNQKAQVPYLILQHDYEANEIKKLEKTNEKIIDITNSFMDRFFTKIFPSFIVINETGTVLDVIEVSSIKLIKKYLKGGE